MVDFHLAEHLEWKGGFISLQMLKNTVFDSILDVESPRAAKVLI